MLASVCQLHRSAAFQLVKYVTLLLLKHFSDDIMRLPPLLLTVLAASTLVACGGGTEAPPAPQATRLMATMASSDIRLYSKTRDSYEIARSGAGYTVADITGLEGTVSVPATARLRFTDTTVDLDPDSKAARVYRLYQAAFNRTPDTAGLSFWIAAHEGGTSLTDIAAGFVASSEYSSVYGSNPTAADTIDRYYQNVLHRAGEQAGVDYWVAALAGGGSRTAHVLAGFSESAENIAGVAATLPAGVSYRESDFTYTPVKPVAHISTSSNVLTGTAVTLNGSASSGGADLLYFWQLVHRPTGSKAALGGSLSASASLTPDTAGIYMVSLLVRDGDVNSTIAVTTVTASDTATPAIPSLWQAPAGSVPASGNFVYLESTLGDFIGQAKTYVYTPGTALLTASALNRVLTVNVDGVQKWKGDFQISGLGSQLQTGYYAEPTRYPFNVSGSAGMSWFGESRACNGVSGWFVIDKVSYGVSGLSEIEARFEQHCEIGTSYLRGHVRWTQ